MIDGECGNVTGFRVDADSALSVIVRQVFSALDEMKKKGASSPEEIKPVEVLIAEAYSIIDKAVKVGTLHKNTGGNRKSRLARAKRALEIQLGWYTPTPSS